MDKFTRFLKVVFVDYWLFSLLLGLQYAFIAWFIYLNATTKAADITIGVSSDSFNIFCGVVATLNGALLGLIIAAIGFITHYAVNNLQYNKDAMLKEGSWLESWLVNKKIQNGGISQKLETIRDICKRASTITEKEVESDEIHDIIASGIDSVENLNEEYRNRTNVLEKECNEYKAKNISEDDKRFLELNDELKHIEEEVLTLEDLPDHLFTISVSFARIHSSFLSFEIVKQLQMLAAIFGIILFGALISLVLSGSSFFMSGSLAERFSADLFRLYIAVSLIFLLSFGVIMIYRILSLHRRVVDFAVGRKS